MKELTLTMKSLLVLCVVVLSSSCFCAQANSSAPAAPPDAAAKVHDNTFVIGTGDVLSINVWKEADISRSIPVRPDGNISLPLVGEVQAAGRTPLKLEQEIAAKLKNYISEPEVTVIVQQINSEKFNILGQVVAARFVPTGECLDRSGRNRQRWRISGLC